MRRRTCSAPRKRKAFAAEYPEPVLTERNVRMVERAMPALREGGAVIAVGALHLVGDDGITSAPEGAFTVSPIPDEQPSWQPQRAVRSKRADPGPFRELRPPHRRRGGPMVRDGLEPSVPVGPREPFRPTPSRAR